MPVLKEETSLFPERLLDGILDDSQSRQWWVLYTKSRREKALARRLLSYEIPFYLPLVENTTIRRGRRLRTLVPLFSGYVFLYGREDERVQSLTTNHISRVLDVPDPEGLRYDLSQLRQLLAAKVPLTMESRLAPGDRVRVRYGPMEGIEGTVLSRRGQVRLLVAVNFLQQGASVEIDDFMLEPIDWRGAGNRRGQLARAPR